MSNPLGWARGTPGNIVEPPEAKKDNGWNAGEPAAAEYMNWWMNEVGGSFGALVLADSNITLTLAELFRALVQTPTANRIITLPSVGVEIGATVWLHNLATAQKFTIESSDGDDICQFQDGSMRLMALQDTPTDRTHWRILDVYGGASPFFSARLSATQSNITGPADQIEFDSERSDNNSNYDHVTNFRFTPTVPGTYLFSVYVAWAALTAGDVCVISLREDGAVTIKASDTNIVSQTDEPQRFSYHLPADGISNFYGVYATNNNRDTSDVFGSPSVDGFSYFQAHRIGN